MIVYRITSSAFATDLSGEGSRLYGGRWNSKGTALLYTSEHPALALLEALAHVTMITMHTPKSLIAIDCPDEWFEPAHNLVYQVQAAALPANWQKSPPQESLAIIGDAFAAASHNIVLKVPSVLMPECSNYLFNCRHPVFSQAKIISHRPVQFDMRLLQKT